MLTDNEIAEFQAILLSEIVDESLRQEFHNALATIGSRLPVLERPIYLFYMLVLQTSQGQGFGTEYLLNRMSMSDFIGRPVYLEATNVNNISFFERVGFEIAWQLELPDSDSTIVTGMRSH